jgi:hypothetical protein
MLRTGIVVAGVLLCGCGSGVAPAASGTASRADPRLQAMALPHPAADSAPAATRTIAARWAARRPPATIPGRPIEIRTVEYTATVFNPGSSTAFTAFITTQRTVIVAPSSAAAVEARNAAPARFATPADDSSWRAAGRPSLGQASASGQRQAIAQGQFSFIPQGSTLTYAEAAALPSTPGGIQTALLDHLRPYSGTHPPASLELKQLAYLIAMAPLTNAARAAAWRLVASLPGLHLCAPQHTRIPGPGLQLCIGSPDDQTELTVNPETGAVISVADRLVRGSQLYPHVSPATIVASSTFQAG